jgi:hypothetical protein
MFIIAGTGDTVAEEERRMKLTELLLAELDREVERSHRALEQVPQFQ